MEKIKVYVCVVGCCKENGGEEILKETKRVIDELKLENQAEVIEAECLGTCKFRPSMMVSDGLQKHYYGKVTPSLVETIIKYHVGLEQSQEALNANFVKVEPNT
uniref:(2Fe-2S) ferredoxin domain-containing protein n=1 Tax=Fervidobacterium pennivorans TaxID=93466 RepID=A0A7V4KEH3_FERPE